MSGNYFSPSNMLSSMDDTSGLYFMGGEFNQDEGTRDPNTTDSSNHSNNNNGLAPALTNTSLSTPSTGSSSNGPSPQDEPATNPSTANSGASSSAGSHGNNTTVETNGNEENNSAGNNGNGEKQKQRRRRKALNCEFCRQRKLKCDRQVPCGNCSKRNLVDQCVYDTKGESKNEQHASLQPNLYNSRITSKGNGKGNATTLTSLIQSWGSGGENGNNTGAGRPTDMKKRLDTMENLVLSLIMDKSANGDNSNNNKDDSMSNSERQDALEAITETLGMMKLDQRGKSVYHGDSHWSTLFTGVEDVHSFFAEIRAISNNGNVNYDECFRDMSDHEKSSTVFPFSSSGFRHATAEDLLRLIPEKDDCRTLIDRYFEAIQPAIPILHRPTLENCYEKFLENPNHVELTFLAQLYGIFILAYQSYIPMDRPILSTGRMKENPSQTLLDWSLAMEQCTTIAKVTVKPSLQNLRVMLLWFLVVASRTPFKDSLEMNWVAGGVLVKCAQSMGLHRDTRWFNLKPYEAEERKKLWSVVVYLDTFLSTVQGLPLGIRQDEVDAPEPSNINDYEVTVSSDKMPRVASEEIITSNSFHIYRDRLTRMLAKVTELNWQLSVSTEKSYEKVKALDMATKKVFDDIPSFLRTRAFDSNLEEPAEVVLHRFLLEVEYLKTLILLHRPFATIHNESRDQMIESAYQMMVLHKWVYMSPEALRIRQKFGWILAITAMQHFLHASISLSMHLLKYYDEVPESKRDLWLNIIESTCTIPDFISWTPMHDKVYGLLLVTLINRVKQMAKMPLEQRLDIQNRSVKASTARTSKSRTMELFGHEQEPFVQSLPENSGAPSFRDAGLSGNTSSNDSPPEGCNNNHNSNYNNDDDTVPVPEIDGTGGLNLQSLLSDDPVLKDTAYQAFGMDDWDSWMNTLQPQQ